MRFIVAILALVAVMCLGPIAVPLLAAAQGQPSGKLDVDINVGHSGGSAAWWTNPIWIAIGAIALIVVILMIVMASRGSGTTVIKE